MSIASATGYSDEQIYKLKPVMNISNFDKEKIETFSMEDQMFVSKEEDRKVLKEAYE